MNIIIIIINIQQRQICSPFSFLLGFWLKNGQFLAFKHQVKMFFIVCVCGYEVRCKILTMPDSVWESPCAIYVQRYKVAFIYWHLLPEIILLDYCPIIIYNVNLTLCTALPKNGIKIDTHTHTEDHREKKKKIIRKI